MTVRGQLASAPESPLIGLPRPPVADRGEGRERSQFRLGRRHHDRLAHETAQIAFASVEDLIIQRIRAALIPPPLRLYGGFTTAALQDAYRPASGQDALGVGIEL